ncbi:MAG: protein phosphatase 2C domain-containing protein [Lachnospiraceae bacterium]
MEGKFIIDDTIIQIVGNNHRENQEEIEDVVYKRKTEKLLFWGIADGQSNKRYCVTGGKAVLEDLAEYVEKKGIKYLSDRIYTDETKYEIVQIIRKCINGLSKRYRVNKEEFSSTLVAWSADPDSGEYFIVHLGDGCIIGITDQDEVKMISAPDNGITIQYTWLTTSDDALMHLRIGFGNIGRYKNIYIMSDGMDCICHGRNILLRGKELLKSGKPELIYEHVSKNSPEDDATCIALKRIE